MSVDQTALLKDLRKQVTALEDDLRERTDSVPEFHDALHAEYDRARAAQRTAASYGAWRDDRVTQAAVAWILATVFVRFCEDNDLIRNPWIAGPGERLAEADERHHAYFREHPEKNDRDWLVAAFDHLASTNQTVAGLFDRNHNPLWELSPSYDAASALLKFWRRTTPEGGVVHDFTDEELSTRFLGDLYQDLSDHAKKTYALLQTPEFVEEFILDLTLEPAIEEFGLEPVWKHKPSEWPGEDPIVRGLRTIDPACGSGHFLLGIFRRLLARWEQEAPGTDRWELIRRTLESVHGCDKNPFAAEIARFRLLVAALHAAGEKRLDHAPAFPINVAVGDSLLHGRGAAGIQTEVEDALFGNEAQFSYKTEDVAEFAARCDLLGKSSYHVVVANPPYITVKDKQENQNYRVYEAASGKYALSIPFAQRIFELAIRTGGPDRAAGFTGQITANSFMKREFGKKLIDWLYREVEITSLVDTSGAYIPGHGTPTVIFAGRNRLAYQGEPIRALLGVRGEPSQPMDAAEGLVWSAIENQIALPGSESEWITVENVERSKLAAHPWSLSGGGASSLMGALEKASTQRLESVCDSIGFHDLLGEDDVFVSPRSLAVWNRVSALSKGLVSGDLVRDWRAGAVHVLWPYGKSGVDVSVQGGLLFWPYRAVLRAGLMFGKTREERGMAWHEHIMLSPGRTAAKFLLAYAEVATHNHFVLDRGGRGFKQTAPVIMLSDAASEDDHLALLGLLNSSAACFWLKQVSHDKGSQSGTGGFMHDEWERFFQFSASKFGPFPLPTVLPLEIGSMLDNLAQLFTALEPAAAVETLVSTREDLDVMRQKQDAVRQQMIAVQEELDWQIYGAYELLSYAEVVKVTLTGHSVTPELHLGERAFEIVLARRIAAGEAESVWFTRHNSALVTEIPAYWPEEYRSVVQARIDLIEKRPRDIGLLERPEYKRRWADEPWEKKEKAALRDWILDRCEQSELWFGLRDGLRHPRAMTVSQVADQFRSDDDMQSMAALYAADHLGKRDLPLVDVLAEVVADQHVPFLASLRYGDTGLRKRVAWERVWELQREEDRTGKRLDIAVPPKYAPKDFRKNSYWSQRGKLDVPKERFISYPGASPDADDTLLLGWAGWDHKDQAQALVNLVNDRTVQGAWGVEKLTPLLAGLLELMPWVHQWHGEYDVEWEGVPAEEFQAFLDDQRGRYQLSEQNLRDWRPPAKGRKKKA